MEERERPKLELTFRQQVNTQLTGRLAEAFEEARGRQPNESELAEMRSIVPSLTGYEVAMIVRWLTGKD